MRELLFEGANIICDFQVFAEYENKYLATDSEANRKRSFDCLIYIVYITFLGGVALSLQRA